jgi:solute carrier family 25 iron transporter 28/37
MFPIDTIKTHQQLAGFRVSMASTTRAIIARDGLMGLFRGLPVVVAGVAPVHGISFSIYELCKQLSGANRPGHHLLASSISGIVATLAHDACLAPIDTIKQRLQFSARPYRGVLDCFNHIYRQEGIGGFYRGYTTAAVMNLPHASIYYGAYESIKKLLKQAMGKDPESNDPLAHMLAGAAGGCLAGGLTNPLDVGKTRLQVGADVGKNYRGLYKTICTIKRDEGWMGFTKGVLPRMLFHSASAAISWTTYEYVKHSLERF